MKQRTAILIAAALTTFVLLLAAGLVYAVNFRTVTHTLAAPPQAVNASAPNDGTMVTESAPPDNSALTALPSPTSPRIVSAERAAQIALRLVPQSNLQQPPALVNYKGKMAYEVLLNTATVYVDAFDEKILDSRAMVSVDTTANPNSWPAVTSAEDSHDDHGDEDKHDEQDEHHAKEKHADKDKHKDGDK